MFKEHSLAFFHDYCRSELQYSQKILSWAKFDVSSSFTWRTIELTRNNPGQQCHSCKKFDHFQRCCRSRRKLHAIRNTERAATDNDAYTDSDESMLCVKIRKEHKKLLAVFSAQHSDERISKPIEFQLDTAASCNVLTIPDYERGRSPKLKPSTTTLHMYDDTEVMPMGIVHLNLQSQDLLFYVMETRNHSSLSMDACLHLGLLTVNQEFINLVRVAQISELHAVLDRFPEVLRGVGCLPGEYDIQIDERIKPVQN